MSTDQRFLITFSLDACFECGMAAKHLHHVVPQSLGGTQVIPLCERCHGFVHDMDLLKNSALREAGVQRARLEGKRVGLPVTDNMIRARTRAWELWNPDDSNTRAMNPYQVARRLEAEQFPRADGLVQWTDNAVKQLLMSYVYDLDRANDLEATRPLWSDLTQRFKRYRPSKRRSGRRNARPGKNQLAF